MEKRFRALVDDLLSEVTRREPSYFDRFAVVVPEIDRVAPRYRDLALFASVPEGDIAAALEFGARHLSARDVDVELGDGDPLGLLLMDGIADAFAAERGLVALVPAGAEPRPIAEILSTDYEEKRAASGVRCFVRRWGSRPLVLVNACGIPLSLWSRFLGDRDHDFRIIVVECRGQDALEGGVRTPCDLSSDAADILGALEHERTDTPDLLAWCDGGKLAIELARSSPGHFRRLVLLSASLRGTRALVQPQSAYESNFGKVISTVAERPSLAPMFAKMLGKQLVSTDWDGLSQDALARAAALLRLPAQEHSAAVRAPLSRDDFLLNHARRIQSDAGYPLDEAIGALDLPLLMIAGDYDHIANNAVARAAMAAGQGGMYAQISGAGHYCFDLQYPYFKLLANAFLIDGSRPPSTARLDVTAL